MLQRCIWVAYEVTDIHDIILSTSFVSLLYYFCLKQVDGQSSSYSFLLLLIFILSLLLAFQYLQCLPGPACFRSLRGLIPHTGKNMCYGEMIIFA